MGLKKLTISVETGQKPVDPLQIFQKLTLRGSIENIWEPQADALRKWHRQRSDTDVAIEMNTGGGKTLVGLIIARSLLNEKKGRVLYVCANNQLVEQTSHRAGELGLSPAVRYKSDWYERREFDNGNEFCLTNYATVFNGKSVFRNEEVDALVFDDAHVAENNIRDQFTLKIPSNREVFSEILNRCRSHFTNSGKSSHFADVVSRRHSSVIFIPMFVVWNHVDEFRKILLDSGIDDDPETLFAWEHLKDHLKYCCFVADGNGLQITPVVLPLSHLSYFQENVRRVYLTATLPSQASFARTFGISEPTIVRPSGKSGEAQRLFVFVNGEDDETQREETKGLVEGQKSCVIAPSAKRGQTWVPPAIIYDASSGQDEIDRFAESKDAEMLGLIARYDGIDLPGDTCKLLILDGLPTGESLIDRFIDESIQVETIRTSHTATRVVQAIGRIFRSNTDHGVVFLIGSHLHSWVRNPKFRAFLPKLLQKQLLLGDELAKKVQEKETTWDELIGAVLSGDKNWDSLYNEYVDVFETNVTHPPLDWHVKLVLEERKALDQLWIGQFQHAAMIYGDLEVYAQQHDPRLAAWYRHWQGLALLCADDRQEALLKFIGAANVRSELGRPSERRETVFRPPEDSKIGKQAKSLARWYRKNKSQLFGIVRLVSRDLQYGCETNKAEEALKKLGSLIGLRANRPDKSKKTGPDVTWQGDGDPAAWGFELKTDKNVNGEYSKKDIAQCHDHKEWLFDNHGDNCALTIVGRMLSVSEQANPFPTLRISEIDAFHNLLDRVKEMYNAIESGDKVDLEQSFQSWLNYHGLNWPDCVESLDSRLAIDRRSE